MPEGDAVHRAALALQALVGERVRAASPSARAAATGVAAAVDGRVLERVEAAGKNLLLTFEGGVVVRSHLRMSGRWRVQPRGAPVTGRPWLVLEGRDRQAVLRNGPVLVLDRGVRARIGPDLLAETADPELLAARVRRGAPGMLLGEALLDQRLVAGIGNMWLAEALWRTALSPWLRVGDVEQAELAGALAAAQALMRDAVDGRRAPRAVHRRAGRPCPRCGERVRSRGLGDSNRTAYWCPGCQRGPSVA